MSNYKIIIDNIVNEFLNGESITLELVKYYNNNDFEDEIITLADKAIFDSFNCDLSMRRKAIVIVALSVIALKYYDGNLWEHIENFFTLSFNGSKDNKARGKIRSILQFYKKDFNYSDPESLIAVPLIISGVTSYWLPSFFNFAFDIYSYNLLLRRQIDDEELEDEMLSTFNTIRKNYINENSDDIKIGNHKTYQLSRYTQSSLKSGDNIYGISNIASTCVRMMINYLNNDYIEIKPFYERAFNEWKDKINKEKSIKENLEEKGQWKISLKFINKKVYIETKTEKIDEQYNPSQIELHILENEKVIDVIKDLDINYDVIGGYLIESKKVEIKGNVLNNISYRIVCNNEILYDSKSKLYLNNKALFFDGYGNQIYPNKDYNGPAFVLSKNEINVSSFALNSNFMTEIFIDSLKGIIIDGEYYVFKTWKRKIGLEGEKYPWADIKTNIDNQVYALYKTSPIINIETTLIKEEIEVYIDNKLDNNINFHKIIGFENGVNYYSIEKDYSVGFHKVLIIGNNKKICEYEFVFDNNASKDIYEENGDLFLNIITSFIEEKYKFYLGESKITVPCYFPGKGHGYYLINPEMVSFSFNNIDWFKKNSRFPKYKFENYLYITGSRDNQIYFYKNKEKIEFVKELLDNEYGKVRVNLSVLDNIESKNVKIEVLNNGKIYNCIIDLTTYINMSNSKMEYDYLNDKHLFLFDFDTNKKIKFSIYDNSNIVFESYIDPNKEIVINNDLEAFKTYRIIITERQNIFKNVTILEQPYFFCRTKDMLNKIFDIENVEIMDKFGKTKILKLFGIRTTIRINKETNEEKNKFIGSIRRRNRYENELAKIGPIFVSVSGEFIGDKIWIYISDEDDELLFYDLEERKVHFTTEINKYTKNMPIITRCLVSLKKGGY